jgi:hypothetical protein
MHPHACNATRARPRPPSAAVLLRMRTGDDAKRDLAGVECRRLGMCSRSAIDPGMSLAVCSDLSQASWIVTSDLPWPRLVTFGPAGFAACARVRFIPDPTDEDQQEGEADLDASPGEIDLWRALLRLLAADTSRPDDCYFGLWEGWGFPDSARRWPTFGVPRGAELPARSYFLFHGSLSEAEIWGSPAEAGIWGLPEFSPGGTPAFVWPSDRTWCVAADIDPHWAGVGASVSSIRRLLADPRLDAVAADPADEQPVYR